MIVRWLCDNRREISGFFLFFSSVHRSEEEIPGWQRLDFQIDDSSKTWNLYETIIVEDEKKSVSSPANGTSTADTGRAIVDEHARNL